ncbi:MAG: histidinol-phosphate aminotransferase family protein [Saprospiraceae bacterium]|nr:histidinol-phosphate aminotransferase family protein [Candidatus Opimibacter iunctus]
MTTNLSRRSWLQRSAMAAAILPVSRWYQPDSYISRSGSPFPASIIRLNSNENAYGPSQAARDAVMDSLNEANRYPRHFMASLREEIARRENLTPEHILLTAGSTELLGLVGLVYGLQGGEVVACNPTFDFMLIYTERLGCRWSRTPLTSTYQYDLQGLAKATGPDTKLIFICNPNNPTGIEIPNGELRAFCETQAKKYPVYVDEAYIELSPNGRESSMASLVDSNPNLIVGRTFSKVHGLAGLRIGYAIANPVTIDLLANFHIGRGMTISSASANAAIACLKDAEFEAYSRRKIIEGREMVCKAFDNLGIEYMPSAANFVFFGMINSIWIQSKPWKRKIFSSAVMITFLDGQE